MLFKSKKKMLYKEFLYFWLEMRKVFIKESTYANYRNLIQSQIIPSIGDYHIDELNKSILQNFIICKYRYGRTDNKGGLSSRSVRCIMMIIKSSLKYAMNEGRIRDINLDFEMPKLTNKDKVEVLSMHDQEILVEYILNNLNIKSIGILLTLYSGLRIGEICALKWKDIDFTNNILTVNSTLQRIKLNEDIEKRKTKIVINTPKTYNSQREIPISKDFSNLLKRFKTEDNDYVLTCKSNYSEPRTYRRYFKRLIRKIGIKDIKFHGLRHTFATNCIKLGVDCKTVSELLGHSNVSTTLNLYVHPEFESKKKCIDMIYNEFAKSKKG